MDVNRRKRNNKLVSTSSKFLSTDERKKLANLIVKPGKIGGYARGRDKSDVWRYFGILAYHQDGANADTDESIVDDNRHYCVTCLDKAKEAPEGRGRLSQVQSYSTSTSTCALIEHLKQVHDIDLKKVSTVILVDVQFIGSVQ